MSATHDDPHAEDAVRAWFASLESDVPADFADDVMTRIEREDACEMQQPRGAVVNTQRSARATRGALGCTFAIAASVLVMLLGRDSLVRDVESPHRETIVVADAIDSQLISLRAEALATLRAQCLPCHESVQAGAVASAVDVFDTSDPHWYATMSAHDFDVAIASIDDGARARFSTYVSAELAARRGAAIDFGT